MRPCTPFLEQRGRLLGDYGFTADPGQVEWTPDGWLVFYHYTRQEQLAQILAPDGGLWARLPVIAREVVLELTGRYLVEGFLQPLPTWISASPYFGNLGLEMMRRYVGNLLLDVG